MVVGSNDWNGLTLSNGRYRITAKLGEGGMGSVYRALDQNIEADVVIKIPRQAMMEDPEFAGRFTREIRSLVKLSHPHIVKVTDVGTWDGTPFAVMQYLPGGSLEDRRPTGPGGAAIPCDPAEVPRWLDAVAAALDYVHEQGYVHRDVKPGNILFDAHGHSFLSDFGVAKVLATSADSRRPQTTMTGAGMVLGTPEYMAPELIMGEAFDGRVDQYALAVTAYELLCGRRPFEDETKTRVLVLHTTKAPPRLTEWCPTIPERVSQAVLKGLAKHPDERYATCAAMAAAVAAATVGSVARDERVRLRCPGCGSMGWIASADLVKLKESGRRLACSACKAPLDLPSTETVPARSRASSARTERMTQPADSDEQVRAPEAGRTAPCTTVLSAREGAGDHTPPRSPTPVAGGTIAMSVTGSPGEPHGENESRPPPTPLASKAALERASTRSHQMVSSPPHTSRAISAKERIEPACGEEIAEFVPAAASSFNPARIWIGIGAGVSGSLLILSFVIWMVARPPVTRTGDSASSSYAAPSNLAIIQPTPVPPSAPPSPSVPTAPPIAVQPAVNLDPMSALTNPTAKEMPLPHLNESRAPVSPTAPKGDRTSIVPREDTVRAPHGRQLMIPAALRNPDHDLHPTYLAGLHSVWNY